MNQLNEQQLQLHVPIVGWILIATHAIFLVIGLFVFMLLSVIGLGVAVRDAAASGFLFIVGTFVAGLMTLLAVPGVVAGVGLLMRWSWARILAIIVAILGLMNFPIGTVIGVYALWVLLQDSAAAYFSHGRNAGVDMTPRPTT